MRASLVNVQIVLHRFIPCITICIHGRSENASDLGVCLSMKPCRASHRAVIEFLPARRFRLWQRFHHIQERCCYGYISRFTLNQSSYFPLPTALGSFCRRILQGHGFQQNYDSMINDVGFLPAGDRVASLGSDKTVRVWDTNNGECQVLSMHTQVPNRMAVAHEVTSYQLATCSFGELLLWNAYTGQLLSNLTEECTVSSLVSSSFCYRNEFPHCP